MLPVTPHPRPILVLGSRVIDGVPGSMLASRLDKALQVAAVYPSAPIIVSGFGEAPAMGQYLQARGIPLERIVVEPNATSTNQNLEYARAMCTNFKRFEVVTNDFHCVRTRLWAWHLGIEVVTHSAPTPWRKRPRNYTREVIATPHSAVRVLWRAYRRLRPARN